MPRINLLPWRAELRQKRKQEFLVALLGAVIVGAVLVYASKLTMQGWIASQNGRNAILKSEIASLDKQIAEITGLENQRERLLARMRVIDQLQRSRPEIVHLFDELVNAVPEGVHFTEVKQTTNRIELQGQAQSSTRVSTLMRNIDDSEFLQDAGLGGIASRASGADRSSEFRLFASQVSTTPEEGEDAEGLNGGVAQ
jgi:type IV pilus assembly protein PilN